MCEMHGRTSHSYMEILSEIYIYDLVYRPMQCFT